MGSPPPWLTVGGSHCCLRTLESTVAVALGPSGRKSRTSRGRQPAPQRFPARGEEVYPSAGSAFSAVVSEQPGFPSVAVPGAVSSQDV